MLRVQLTDEEWEEAKAIGVKRHEGYKKRGEGVGFDGRTTPLVVNLRGAAAEMALAKHLGPDVLEDWRKTKAYVESNHRAIDADVGKNIQVRSTTHPNGCLPVWVGDRATSVMVQGMVHEQTRSVSYTGWIVAAIARQLGRWRDDWPDPAYCADQYVLEPIETLPPEAVR